jgi:hypothetical protein
MIKTAFLTLCLSATAHAAPIFVEEVGVRLSSAVLQGATAGQISGSAHFYYLRGSSAVFSATTPDSGQSFIADAGVRLSTMTQPVLAISSITGLCVLPLSGGGWRMLYSAISTNSAGASIYGIYSATSTDGLAWANDTGTRLSGGTGFVGSPSLVNLGANQWRLYYTANNDGTTVRANRRLFTALSSDQGRDFGSSVTIAGFNSQVGEVAAIARTDGRVRLFYTAPLTGSTTNSTIISALSSDANGTSFAAEGASGVSTTAASGFLSSPFVLRSTETWRWKLYYDYTPFPVAVSSANVFSATVFAPDPGFLSPSTVLNSGASGLTINGEIFQGPTPPPTLQLSQGNVNVSGTNVGCTNDQTLTATFNMTGQAIGYWNLTVVNANGTSAILPNALNVTFPNGSVTLTDNLLRPRNGTKTKIVIETFNPGPLAVKIYTTTGGLVNTLFDSYAPMGVTTLLWDGTTAAGHTVASGVYLLETVGQKLTSGEKIVVIK